MKRAIALFCMLSLLATSFVACGKKEEYKENGLPSTNTTTEPTTASVPQGVKNLNPLTGEELRAEAVGKRPIAIMVENHPQARPQWGFSTPDVVIEGLVEGGITRMMWLYADVQDIPKIGPVRSARHDYVELADGFDAIYVHFGGSKPLAYDSIAKNQVNDIDGLTNGDYFKRDTSRKVSREHTAYTQGEWIEKAIANKNFRTQAEAKKAHPFSFSGEKRSLSGGVCQSAYVFFSDSYTHNFVYNEKDGLYYNHMGKNAMKDANGQAMAVQNVLILYTQVDTLNDAPKHREWDLTGGKGVYISNGTYQNIRWSKGTTNQADAPLKLMNENGAVLELNPGKSWIGFAPAAHADKTKLS